MPMLAALEAQMVVTTLLGHTLPVAPVSSRHWMLLSRYVPSIPSSGAAWHSQLSVPTHSVAGWIPQPHGRVADILERPGRLENPRPSR
ncbi:hypothetical protein B0H14DRAFT_2845343 [Mycena olivaceomarginata]|nr:hypothetical protein B0H14DRAFT_2845343 [Mycena olivaceomarginata]